MDKKIQCIASSWRAKALSPYGPGKLNRCIFRKDHGGYHRDRLGNIFVTNPFKIIRQEKV